MTQKAIKIFIKEIYSKPPMKNYPTNKTNIYHFDNIWILDRLDLKDYGVEKNRNHRYVSVIIDMFSKFEWTVPLKEKCSNNKTFIRKYYHKFEKQTKFNRK